LKNFLQEFYFGAKHDARMIEIKNSVKQIGRKRKSKSEMVRLRSPSNEKP
jgi:hypothetical protein